MRLNCKDVLESLPLYVGNDLSTDGHGQQLSSRVKEHLDSCLLCNDEYESYAYCRDLLNEASNSGMAKASKNFWSSIEEQIEVGERNRWRFRWLVLAASFAIIFFAAQLGSDSAQLLSIEENILVASESRVKSSPNSLVRQLTLEEQIEFLNQQKHFYDIAPLNRLGIPSVIMASEQPSVVNY